MPWYANIVKYLACVIMPLESTYQQKMKFRTDAIFYIWDDPMMFRKGAYHVIRRCVPETKKAEILDKCHASPYGGHIAGDRTTQKILLANIILR